MLFKTRREWAANFVDTTAAMSEPFVVPRKKCRRTDEVYLVRCV
jgi:hypothetical protein